MESSILLGRFRRLAQEAEGTEARKITSSASQRLGEEQRLKERTDEREGKHRNATGRNTRKILERHIMLKNARSLAGHAEKLKRRGLGGGPEAIEVTIQRHDFRLRPWSTHVEWNLGRSRKSSR